jgi:hypothetical protein
VLGNGRSSATSQNRPEGESRASAMAEEAAGRDAGWTPAVHPQSMSLAQPGGQFDSCEPEQKA